MTNEKGWQQFIELCDQVSDRKQLNELLIFILTPEEREQLSSRVILVKELLKQEKTQREIAAAHGISIAKITRGSNSLKQIKSTLRAYLLAKLI